MNRFQETKRLFPNIEWLRTRSATPREVHLAYVGRVWPMDDPFLQTNHPGCVWGCKCDWRNTDKAATDNQDLKPVPASPGLEGNPASTNEIFTDKHPYFKRVDKHIPELGVLNNPDELVFLKQKDANGKPFLMHYNNRSDNELQKNLRAVAALNTVGFGKEIKLLPQIHYTQIALRERYYGKAFQKMQKFDCPDAMIDGVLAEFKSGTIKMASKRILQASQKASVVYLEITDKLSTAYLDQFIARQWTKKDRMAIQTIIVTNGDVNKIYTRP